MDALVQTVFDGIWNIGSKVFYWTFDGWIEEKINFDPLWNELKMFNSIGNKPILKSYNTTEKTKVYLFTIPVGMTIDNFRRNITAIAQYLHEDQRNIRIELVNNMAAVTVYDTSKLSFEYKDYKFNTKGKEVKVPIGINLRTFEPVIWQPTSPNECHLLIGGSTGAGKSVCLKVIMEYLANRDDVELYIQDTKVIDLVSFSEISVQYNEGKDYATETTAHLVDIMNSRYKELKGNNNKKFNHIFYIVEELASFNPKEDKEFYNNLAELLAKGRAASIGVIITTQAPYSEILPGMLKNNINTIIGLKTRTGEASKVICNNYDALTKLRGRGHAILFNADGETEMQVFNI